MTNRAFLEHIEIDYTILKDASNRVDKTLFSGILSRGGTMTEAAVRPTIADTVIQTLADGDMTTQVGRNLVLMLTHFIVIRSIPNQEERVHLRAAYEKRIRDMHEYGTSPTDEPPSTRRETAEAFLQVFQGAVAMLDLLDRDNKRASDPAPST